MLSSRTLAGRIARATRASTSTKGSKDAVWDRYATICQFFRQHGTQSPTYTVAIAHVRKCDASIGVTLGRGRYGCSLRQFHASLTRFEQQSRRSETEPEPPNTSTRASSDDPAAPPDGGPSAGTPPRLDNYPPLFQRLARSLPHPHRPTREDFLRVANSFWDRLRIRFRWFTIRSFRRFNADDISAFVTWFLMSQTLWIFVGTTTFFSVILATANSLRLQEYVARAISNYLTKETGITVIFETAIVPKWKDSRLSLKNVYISRRPPSVPPPSKISRDHTAALGYDISGHPAIHGVAGEIDEEEALAHVDLSEEDLNYTMFDLNVDAIEVTLSLPQWLDGKGLIKDAVVKGVRGVIDRRNVTWDPDHPLDPALFRHKPQPGDFELEFLQLEDVLVTVYQPGNFRPYTASIFRADIRRFRKQWLFYDFLNAENVVGQFDNCLFSLHTPQSIGRTTEKELGDGKWGRMSRLRIDGVNIDHLQSMTTLEGPISWITYGKVDAVLDIKFPRDEDPDALDVIIDAIATTVAEHIPGQRELAKPPLTAPTRSTDNGETVDDGKPKVVIDIDLRFRDIKAAVPMFTNDLSYVNSAFVRPIVAFMNANRTLIPIHCRVIQDLSDFEGAWTLWETGLSDQIALQVYDALAYHVNQANFNRRVKTVSLWSLQKTAAAILSALRTMVDPMSIHLKELSANGGNLVGRLEFANGVAM
ncbi:hypothetical protein GLOTRDRAFT_73488 [Gloeophyllum trabeum ATCC 11539]|uniref:Mitochondrial distribution and morphology protein family 31/32 n=1 Tax=Gloeophyllum trabeum (strain ATCC 11539 / FP-39264 / Madison 617) TaxID=670483 RepID=S7QCE2_GLOTA|nr:uncharacterized protein GLOTRDRAFT_73488 [Gloeophyllum trabeum ATCC 11539]EPQ56997.1 hypothetical protein GLOTRDRAFT_73488 [Gloeophyllum trabeum ATCC 11539]